MAIDVTDATFERDVIERSLTTPVIVDLWAPWCGPCRTLGPILEKVTDATNGQVVMVKVNVDENPAISQAFRVQSIPAVYAVAGGQVVDGFVGAQPEHLVEQFVASLLPSPDDDLFVRLLEAGDEASLRQALDMQPDSEDVIVALAELLVADGRNDEALALLARIPETDLTRHIAALARVNLPPDDDHDATLTALLDRVKDDDEARQQFVDILELMGPHDPRTAQYRRQLASRLY
ncbi:MAG: tetratricopeptide repeat protein [Actinomycetota bacterium]